MARKKLISIKSIKLRPRKIKQPKIKPVEIKNPENKITKAATVKKQAVKVVEQPKTKKEKYKRKKIQLTTVKTKKGRKFKKASLSKKLKKKKKIKKQNEIYNVSSEPLPIQMDSYNIINSVKSAINEMLSIVSPYSRRRGTAIDSAQRLNAAIDNLVLNYGETAVARMLESAQEGGYLEISVQTLYNSEEVTQAISKFASLIDIDDSFDEILDVIGDDMALEMYGTYLEYLM